MPDQTPVDPFDLGDTSKVTPTETPSPAPEARPRNADGTFAPVVPPKPQHPAHLVSVAKSFGYSEAELEAIPTEQLNAECWRLNQHRENMRAENATLRDLQPAPRQPAPVQAPQEPDDDVILTELEQQGFEPKLVGIMRKFAKENKALKSALGDVNGLKQREQQREVRTLAETIDSAINEFERPDLFGEGDIGALPEQSAETILRLTIAAQAKIKPEDSMATIRKKIKAVGAAIVAKIPKSAPAAPAPSTDPYEGAIKGKTKTPTKEEWAQAALQRPAGREKPALPDGDQKAISGVKAKLDALSSAEEQEVLNGLLD